VRFQTFFGFFFRLTLDCTDPDTNPCSSALTALPLAAVTFCATYSKTSNTLTTSLPAYATFCSNKLSKLPSVCSCLVVESNTAKTTAKTATIVIIGSYDISLVYKTPNLAQETTRASTKLTTSTTSKVSPATTNASGTGTACICTMFSQISSAVASCNRHSAIEYRSTRVDGQNEEARLGRRLCRLVPTFQPFI
jgi:hypothetical protein